MYVIYFNNNTGIIKINFNNNIIYMEYLHVCYTKGTE